MAVYTPALMLQDGGADGRRPSAIPVEVAYVVVKACLGIGLWGAAVVGFLAGPHGCLGAAPRRRRRASLLVLALPLTDEIGFALAAVVIGCALVAAAAAPSAAMSLCILAGGAVTLRSRSRLHPRLDPFGRAVALGGGLAGRAAPASRSSRPGSRAPAPGWSPAPAPAREGGWWVWQPTAPPAELVLAASGATGGGWRLCAAGGCRDARRHARPAGPAAALRRLIPVPGRGAWLNECVAADFVATGKLQKTDGKPTPMSSG